MNPIRSRAVWSVSRNVFAAGTRSMPRRGSAPMAQARCPAIRSFHRGTPFAMGSDERLPKLTGLKIDELEYKESAKRRTQRGDTIDVHYRGTLASDNSEFDASYNRGQPLSFTVGKGQVIKGWDEGLLNMAVGEKRKLTIQPDLGYGARGMGPIPANSVLIFETELVSIKGVSKDEL